MATSGKFLAQAQFAASDTLIYEPINVTAFIDQFTVCNTTGGAVTVTVAVVRGGGALADANTIYKTFSVAAGATEILSGIVNQRLNSGDELRGLASAATSVAYFVSGREDS